MPRQPLPFTPKVRRRLRRVITAILNEPHAYNQSTFGDTAVNSAYPATSLYHGAPIAITCGSPACIAGWYQFFTPPAERLTWADATLCRDIGYKAAKCVIDGRANLWPSPFGERFRARKTAQGKAKVAAERLEHLLRTGE